MSMMNDQITRIRIRYAKGESLRFIGHLDIQRLWERALRRSRLPVRYSQGFHPRARLNLASALPLGFLSDEELLEFWMNKPLPLLEIVTELKHAVPPGLIIHSAQEVDLREDSLQKRLRSSEFEVSFFDYQPFVGLEQKVANLLSQDSIPYSRRNKVYDLRPLIQGIQVVTLQANDIGLWMNLKAESGATGRPDDILTVLGYGITDFLVKRTKLIFS